MHQTHGRIQYGDKQPTVVKSQPRNPRLHFRNGAIVANKKKARETAPKTAQIPINYAKYKLFYVFSLKNPKKPPTIPLQKVRVFPKR